MSHATLTPPTDHTTEPLTPPWEDTLHDLINHTRNLPCPTSVQLHTTPVPGGYVVHEVSAYIANPHHARAVAEAMGLPREYQGSWRAAANGHFVQVWTSVEDTA